MSTNFQFSIKYLLSSFCILAVALSIGLSSTLRSAYRPVQNYITDTRKTIIIDAGHGGEDCGAIGVNGVFEKDINLQMAFHLASYLELAGCKTVLTRTEDKLLYNKEENIYGQRKVFDLKNRLLMAEQYDNGILVSLHMNSFPASQYSGLQVWYNRDNSLSKQLAESVQKTVQSHLQPENHRQIKQADQSIYLLDRSSHPAILIECGFLSNPNECEKLSHENYQKELSFAVFCAILNALDEVK